ncbi:hypothetical protein [Methylobacterium sp. 285MFTsu5.1]|uniref:DUF6894 family protein n=1 Tax=Methylobacterium sp. 285MFTsu5.1 TaxID=1172187 RepID=UPI0003766113|nr:hypothetical protein [Methylobacterium sp. 285MFTsu5.1]
MVGTLSPWPAEHHMPRYFIVTSDHVTVRDDEGVQLSGRDALRDTLRRLLTEILRDEGYRTEVNEFTAQAYDEAGKLVMSARANFSATDQ